MAKQYSPADLAGRIERLVEERQRHLDAIAEIDQRLSGVGAALGNGSSPARGRPAGGRAAAEAGGAPAKAAPGRKAGGRRRRGRFPVSGEQSVLKFVTDQRNPTSREIEQHWRGEGRGGPAAIMLSKLVKEKKLKRTPLGEGQRGSRYSLP